MPVFLRSFQCELSATRDPISAVEDVGPGPPGQCGNTSLYAFHGTAGRRPPGPVLVGGREFSLHQLVAGPSAQPELSQTQHSCRARPFLRGRLGAPGSHPKHSRRLPSGRRQRQPHSAAGAAELLQHRSRPKTWHPQQPGVLQDRDSPEGTVRERPARPLQQTHEK